MSRLVLVLALLAAPDEWAEFLALSKDKDPDTRIKAIEKIKAYADLRMVQMILPLAGDENARVQGRAVGALSKATGQDCVDFLCRNGLRNTSRAIRMRTAETLGLIKNPKSAAPLTSSLTDGDPEVRAAAATALMQLDARAAIESLTRTATNDPAWQPRAMALEALVHLDSANAAPLLTKAMTAAAYQVRLMAMSLAPSLELSEALSIFATAVGDSDWRVRVQAIETACELRDRALIGPLIELLAKEKGRLRLDLHMALADLTHKDLGFDSDPWRRWWDMNRETFEVPPKGGRAEGEPEGGGTGVHFFKVPILSTRMVFLLDLSGSMRDPAPGEQRTKLDLIKRETIKTINALTEPTQFNIVTLGCDANGRYAKDQKRWKKGLIPADARGRADGAAFTARQVAWGWTNVWDGLALAFEDDLVDTIYLYTDGGVSRGLYVATNEILAELRKVNRFHKIMINTVEAAADKPNTADNIRLLKELAAQTKGLYQLAK